MAGPTTGMMQRLENLEKENKELKEEQEEQKKEQARLDKKIETLETSLRRLHKSRIQPVNMAKEVDEGG